MATVLTRLIPARAGNTRCPARRLPVAAAHPRSRGEHLGWGAWVAPVRGSSPLARGTQGGDEALVASVRLIPARAGNTQRSQ